MSKQIVMDVLPKCGFCKTKDARYKSQVCFGGRVTWAYSCPNHWRKYRVSERRGPGLDSVWSLTPRATM